jgi:hypothetical protein
MGCKFWDLVHPICTYNGCTGNILITFPSTYCGVYQQYVRMCLYPCHPNGILFGIYFLNVSYSTCTKNPVNKTQIMMKQALYFLNVHDNIKENVLIILYIYFLPHCVHHYDLPLAQEVRFFLLRFSWPLPQLLKTILLSQTARQHRWICCKLDFV